MDRASRAHLILARFGASRRAARAGGRLRTSHPCGPDPRSWQGRSRLPGVSDITSFGKESAVRLKDKAAIITGAASGIGKEIAIVFAHEGAKVAIADLNQKAADATANEIDPSGKRAIGVAMDVASEEQVEAGTKKTIGAFGTLDVLISNAGIQIVAPVVDFDFAKWKRMLSNPSRRCLPHDPRRAATDVQTEERQHHLHGLGAFEGSFQAQGTVCLRQACPTRPGAGSR